MLKLITTNNVKNIGTIEDILNNIDEISKMVNLNLLQSFVENKDELYTIFEVSSIFKCPSSHIKYILKKYSDFITDEDKITLGKDELCNLLKERPHYKYDKIKTFNKTTLLNFKCVVKIILLSSNKYIEMTNIKLSILDAYNNLIKSIAPKEILYGQIEIPIEISTPEDDIKENDKKERTMKIESNIEMEPIEKKEENKFNSDLYDFDKINFEFIDLYAEYLNKIEDNKLKAYLLATDVVINNLDIKEVLRKLIEDKIEIDFNLRKSFFAKTMINLSYKKCNGNIQKAYFMFAKEFKEKTEFDLFNKKKDNNCKFVDIIEKYELWTIAKEILEDLLK